MDVFFKNKIGLNLEWTVTKIAKTAIGGPSTATAIVNGSEINLYQLFNFLGEPVEIKFGSKVVWWGEVYEVIVLGHQVSLRRVANAVQSVYQNLSREQVKSGWFKNEQSIEYFGRREHLVSSSASTLIDAENDAKTYLELWGLPSIEAVSPNADAQVIFKGFWERTKQKYFSYDLQYRVDLSISQKSKMVKIGQGTSPILQASFENSSGEKKYIYVNDLPPFFEGEQISIAGATNFGNNGIKTIVSQDDEKLEISENVFDPSNEDGGLDVVLFNYITINPINSHTSFIQEVEINADWYISQIDIKIAKVGYPSEDVFLYIWRNHPKSNNAYTLIQCQINSDDLSGDLEWIIKQLDAPILIEANSRYYIEIKVINSNFFNYYVVGVDEESESLLCRIEGVVKAKALLDLALNEYRTISIDLNDLYLSPSEFNGLKSVASSVESILTRYNTKTQRVILFVTRMNRVEISVVEKPSGPAYLKYNATTQELSTSLGIPVAPKKCIVGKWVDVNLPIILRNASKFRAKTFFCESSEWTKGIWRPTKKFNIFYDGYSLIANKVIPYIPSEVKTPS